MSAVRRPSDETLAAFATGRLDEGLALVLAAHLETDAESRARLADVQAMCGVLLDESEPVAMDSGASDALARINGSRSFEPVRRVETESELPRVLRPYELDAWRRVGPRIAMRRVSVPDAQARVFVLRARPGVVLPRHRHSGLEWTAIIDGAYEHEYGRFAAGDFDEADASHEHTPRVDPVEGCTCIAAVTGEILFQSWLGRLVQPLVRL